MKKYLLILVTALFLTGTASAFKFNQPFDSGNSYYDTFGSAQNLTFQGNFEGFTPSNDGTLEVYSKDLTDTSFTDSTLIPGGTVVTSWDDFSELPLSNVVLDSTTISNGVSQTVTLCGNEHTYEYNGLSSSETANMTIDGAGPQFFTEGESDKTDSNCGIYTQWVSVSSSQITLEFKQSDYYHNTGYYEYKLFYSDNGGNFLPGDEIIFSVGQGGNIPSTAENPSFNKRVGSDSTAVATGNIGGELNNMTVGSWINVSINDPNGDATSDIKWYDGSGTLLTDNDTTSLDTSKVDGFVDQTNTNYSFYVQVNDGSVARNTVTTDITTAGTIVTPQVTSFEAATTRNNSTVGLNFTDLVFNDNVLQLEAEIYNPDYQINNVQFELFAEYDDRNLLNKSGYETTNRVGNTSIFTSYGMKYATLNDINESGEWFAKLNISTENDGVITEYRNFTIPWGDLSLTLDQPSTALDVIQDDYFWLNATLTCSTGECVNQNETLKIFADPWKNMVEYGVAG